jgi:2-dehydro-3-deoxyphosphooctonate aldolase (KDO 8-P synthase)
LELIAKVGKTLGVPTLTDVHAADECSMAAEYVDVLQIPAFLCRQTDLLLAAGKTGKWVNIKKAQFLNGDAMKFAAEKVKSTGNERIWLTERGNMFGYGDMVVDFRNITEMKAHGFPVVMDITHSVQQPNNGSGVGFLFGNPSESGSCVERRRQHASTVGSSRFIGTVVGYSWGVFEALRHRHWRSLRLSKGHRNNRSLRLSKGVWL